ncbi:OmpL47-type beta-barrel domain-containing protein [Methanocella arvoryzae]|uniref:OmpL47-type beta-barrel domain-containing protein n=1 Tax=Methanocella arvoryzae TaxID=1175445 RepID=UPI001305204F|nr:FlgD immunoglobulin-like domain containing protein [Methanocella arvoryzae]
MLIATAEVHAASASTTITDVVVNADRVTIYYALSNTAPSLVQFEITDSKGSVVRTLSESGKLPGSHNIVWDCKDSSGKRVPTGTYTVKLAATGKIIGGSTEVLHDFYIDSDGMIFVTAAFGSSTGSILVYNSTASYWGSIGSDLEVPWGIAKKFDSGPYYQGGTLYVTDYYGETLSTIKEGKQSTKGLSFEPKCAAFNSTGYLFILSSAGEGRVYVLDSSGKLAYSFSVAYPTGLYIDSSDNIYVTGNDRLSIYTPAGSLTGTPFKVIGVGKGTGNNQFNQPTGVAVYNGRIYVADNMNKRIQIFDSNGNYIQTYLMINTAGEGVYPEYLHFDSNGNLYMSTGHSLNAIYAPSSRSFTTVDIFPPTVTCKTNVTPRNGWYNSDVEVTVSVTDDYAGVKSLKMGWNNDSISLVPVNLQDIPKFYFDDEGNTTLYWMCEDNANNVVYGNITISIDKTKPEIYGAPDPLANAYGWHKGDVVVRFTASDARSGVAFTSSDVTVTGECTNWSVVGSAEDCAGNRNTTSVLVSIDRTPPVITGGPTSVPNSNGWYNRSVQVNFTATDARSGVEHISPNVTLAGEGSGQSATCTAVDKACNTATKEITGINIDLTAPQTKVSLSGTTGSSGCYVGDVTLTLSCNDSLSGVKTTEYSTDGSTWTTYSGPVTFSNEGTITVYYRSVDNADNVEDMKSVTFILDRTAPVSSAALSGTMGDNDWYVSDVVVTITAVDKGPSGVRATEYSLDGSTWQPYTAPVTFPADGTTTVYYRSVDNAGNLEADKQVSFKIDKTLPAITGTLSGERSSLGWFEGDASLSLSYGDDLSGVRSVMYSLDGSSWHTYTGTVKIPKAGSHYVYYGVIDNAGNRKNGTSHVYFPPASVQYLWSLISPTATPTPTPAVTPTPGAEVTPSPAVAPTPEVTPTPMPTTTVQTSPGNNWWLYLSGLLVVGLAGAGAYFLFLRK